MAKYQGGSTFAFILANQDDQTGMNLFISGTQELNDWVWQHIESTRSQLLAPPLRLHLQITSDPALADCVVTEGSGVSTVEHSLNSERTVPRFLILQPEDCSELGCLDRDFFLIRGPSEALQFAQIAVSISQRARLLHLSEMIGGPVHHDLRGSLSVLALSQQLIDSGAESRLVSPKLRRAGDKLAVAMGYLQHHAACATNRFPPAEHSSRALDLLQEIQKAFSGVHVDRTLELAPSTDAALRRAPDWVIFALGGVIDGCARLSEGPVKVEATHVDDVEGLRFTVLGGEPSLSADQVRALAQPLRLSITSPAIIPYRLATASAMIFGAAGELTIALSNTTMTFVVRLP